MLDPDLKLYAGRLSRHEPQFHTHWGITPFAASSRNIRHDLIDPLPIPDSSVSIFQSQDVFEHIDLKHIIKIIDEIHRVLKPNGLFRFSVPDYRSDIYKNRSKKGLDGDIVFDPGGGGTYEDGRVVGGGHLWFPVIETIKEIFSNSAFFYKGEIKYLHYYDETGFGITNHIDYSNGYILRTPDHDERVMNPRRPLSIVVDALKF